MMCLHAGHVVTILQKGQSRSGLQSFLCLGAVLVEALGTLVDTADCARTTGKSSVQLYVNVIVMSLLYLSTLLTLSVYSTLFRLLSVND